MPKEPGTTKPTAAPELTKPSVRAVVDSRNDKVTITLVGPADRWFAIGFDAVSMRSAPHTVVVDELGAVRERKLKYHAAGETMKRR